MSLTHPDNEILWLIAKLVLNYSNIPLSKADAVDVLQAQEQPTIPTVWILRRLF